MNQVMENGFLRDSIVTKIRENSMLAHFKAESDNFIKANKKVLKEASKAVRQF